MEDQRVDSLHDMNERLAHINARTNQFIDTLFERLDQMVAATKSQDWDEVLRISDYINNSSQFYCYHQVANSCQQLSFSIRQQKGALEIQKRMMQLIGECGRINNKVSTKK